jgi:hypothetical protein
VGGGVGVGAGVAVRVRTGEGVGGLTGVALTLGALLGAAVGVWLKASATAFLSATVELAGAADKLGLGECATLGLASVR